jgi:hypothetical protein
MQSALIGDRGGILSGVPFRFPYGCLPWNATLGMMLQPGVQGFMAENSDDSRDKAENFRAQAARYRRLARQTTDRDIAHRLWELAQEFEQRELEIGKRCI